MHMPQGSQEKGGTAAGAAMVTALLSLAMGRPVSKQIVIAGEVTLTGKILPISNVKASVLAARNHEAKMLILPIANKPEWEELEAFLKQNLEVRFVGWYSEVFDAVFTAASPAAPSPKSAEGRPRTSETSKVQTVDM
jgi:Lon-like ATP-dependent protease